MPGAARAAPSRHAPARGAGRGARAERRAQGDPGHERRRDLADDRGRHRRDRQRPAQGAALRPRARRSTGSSSSGSPRTRRRSARAAPDARGPAAWCGSGTSAIACARSREPEIERVDLAPPALDVLAWGADPRAFEWFEAPPAEPLAAAMALLERLGASAQGRLTTAGAAMQRLPVHPRLARVLLVGGRRGARRRGVRRSRRGLAARRERRRCRPRTPTCSRPRTGSATLPQAFARPPASCRTSRPLPASPGRRDADERLRRALLAGFPDRVARRREPGSPRLAAGVGHRRAARARERRPGRRAPDRPRDHERGGGRRGRSRSSAWRAASSGSGSRRDGRETVHRFDEESGVGPGRRARDTYESLVLAERPVPPDPDAGRAAARRGTRATRASARRASGSGDGCGFAGLEAGPPRRGARGLSRAHQPAGARRARALLDASTRATLDRLAPERLALPSGRTAALEYRDDGSVFAAVKLQELFGLAETPRIGPRREPVVFELLAPNGRPVQTTRDLRSFWERTYPEVRKELRGRYPRHPWPEDPWTAMPTHRTKNRR